MITRAFACYPFPVRRRAPTTSTPTTLTASNSATHTLAHRYQFHLVGKRFEGLKASFKTVTLNEKWTTLFGI